MEIDFVTSGLSAFFTDAFGWLVKKAMIARFEMMIFTLELSYDIAKEVVDSLNLTVKIQEAFTNLDSDTMKILYKCKVFDFINLVMNGTMTAIVFRFLPF